MRFPPSACKSMNSTLHFSSPCKYLVDFSRFHAIFKHFSRLARMGQNGGATGGQWRILVIIKITSRATFHLVVFGRNLDHASLWVLAFYVALHLLWRWFIVNDSFWPNDIDLLRICCIDFSLPVKWKGQNVYN